MSTSSVEALEQVASVEEAAAPPAVVGTSTTPSTVNRDRRKHVGVRVHTDTMERAKYWASRRGFSSANEYIVHAVEEQIRRENLDYDLPTLEIARLNQLVDEVKTLSTNQANLERVMTTSLESLIGLTRGDNYLLDPEDGELA